MKKGIVSRQNYPYIVVEVLYKEGTKSQVDKKTTEIPIEIKKATLVKRLWLRFAQPKTLILQDQNYNASPTIEVTEVMHQGSFLLCKNCCAAEVAEKLRQP